MKPGDAALALGFTLVHRNDDDGEVWSRNCANTELFIRYEQLEWDDDLREWTAHFIRADGVPLWGGPVFTTAEAAFVHAQLVNWGRPGCWSTNRPSGSASRCGSGDPQNRPGLSLTR